MWMRTGNVQNQENGKDASIYNIMVKTKIILKEYV